MYIFTRKKDDVIIEKCEVLGEQSNGNYLLDPTGEPDMGRVAIPKNEDIKVFEIEQIPEYIEVEKYCYTKKKGFYKNEAYEEPVTAEQQIEELQLAVAELGELIAGGME